jgi:DNA-binding response OmpR family regulator
VSTATGQRRVLVVDDDEAIARAFRQALLLEGYDVRMVFDADAALHEAETFRPHAIISDLRMPRVDGFQLLTCLRANEHLRQVPVVIVTGDYHISEAQIADIRRLGADVRFKPLWLEELTTLTRAMVESVADVGSGTCPTPP